MGQARNAVGGMGSGKKGAELHWVHLHPPSPINLKLDTILNSHNGASKYPKCNRVMRAIKWITMKLQYNDKSKSLHRENTKPKKHTSKLKECGLTVIDSTPQGRTASRHR